MRFFCVITPPELDDFLQELDEDVEGMQSTILFLQQELKLAKDGIANLERENAALKSGAGETNCICSNNGMCGHIWPSRCSQLHGITDLWNVHGICS